MNQQLKKKRPQGRPPLYPTAGRKTTVHLPDEAFAEIIAIAEREGVNRHYVARTALMRGLRCGAIKSLIVESAVNGIIPESLAERLIQEGGLSNA